MARSSNKNAPISSDNLDTGTTDVDPTAPSELQTITPGIDVSITDNSDGNGNGGGSDSGSSEQRTYTGKKRGRKPGQKSAPRAEVAVSISGVEKILLGIHSGIVAITKNPIWELQKDEAKALSDATAKVAAHYGAAIDPKTADILVLAGVVAGIYAPRIFATVMTKKPQQKQVAPTNVQAIRPDVVAQAQDMAFNANLPPISGTAMQ